MTYIPSIIVGGFVSAAGILIGNIAIAKMMDAYEENLSERDVMFSTGEIVNSNKRYEAGAWYRKTHPNGPLQKRLRMGQVLSVAGFFVTFALLAL